MALIGEDWFPMPTERQCFLDALESLRAYRRARVANDDRHGIETSIQRCNDLREAHSVAEDELLANARADPAAIH